MGQPQKKSYMIVTLQGVLMIAVAATPFFVEFRPPAVPTQWADWVGAVGFIAGMIIVFSAVHTLRRAFTIHTAIRQDTQLVTAYPFNFSRNPMYLGGLLQCFAWSLLQRSWLTFVLTLALMFLLNFKVQVEEKNLESVFGEVYLKYKNSVRRFI